MKRRSLAVCGVVLLFAGVMSAAPMETTISVFSDDACSAALKMNQAEAAGSMNVTVDDAKVLTANVMSGQIAANFILTDNSTSEFSVPQSAATISAVAFAVMQDSGAQVSQQVAQSDNATVGSKATYDPAMANNWTITEEFAVSVMPANSVAVRDVIC